MDKKKIILSLIFIFIFIILINFTSALSTDNIVGYWNLDDVYTDESGHGLTLTPTASPTFASGIINNGSDLERGSSQILSREIGSLYLDLPHTINLWVKPESLNANQRIFQKDSYGTRSVSDVHTYVRPYGTPFGAILPIADDMDFL